MGGVPQLLTIGAPRERIVFDCCGGDQNLADLLRHLGLGSGISRRVAVFGATCVCRRLCFCFVVGGLARSVARLGASHTDRAGV